MVPAITYVTCLLPLRCTGVEFFNSFLSIIPLSLSSFILSDRKGCMLVGCMVRKIELLIEFRLKSPDNSFLNSKWKLSQWLHHNVVKSKDLDKFRLPPPFTKPFFSFWHLASLLFCFLYFLQSSIICSWRRVIKTTTFYRVQASNHTTFFAEGTQKGFILVSFLYGKVWNGSVTTWHERGHDVMCSGLLYDLLCNLVLNSFLYVPFRLSSILRYKITTSVKYECTVSISDMR